MTLRKTRHASLTGGPFILRKGWPHDPAKNAARWPHVPANWQAGHPGLGQDIADSGPVGPCVQLALRAQARGRSSGSMQSTARRRRTVRSGCGGTCGERLVEDPAIHKVNPKPEAHRVSVRRGDGEERDHDRIERAEIDLGGVHRVRKSEDDRTKAGSLLVSATASAAHPCFASAF